MIFDSHVHIDIENTEGFRKLFQGQNLGGLVNADSVFEYEGMQRLKFRNENIFISFGIHPWKANSFLSEKRDLKIEEKISSLENYYKAASAVGEIGMDSVWCDVDLTIQKAVFIAQLEMAESLIKPVVLHTKGQEKEIAQVLRNYSVKKLVHWYSCKDYLEEYIEQDCYFTIGPDFKSNQALASLMQRVPIDRLLVETDGIVAAQWALRKKVSEEEIPAILTSAMEAIADIKKVKTSEVEKILEENFYRFLD
jgi:TatD DNase family protein